MVARRYFAFFKFFIIVLCLLFFPFFILEISDGLKEKYATSEPEISPEQITRISVIGMSDMDRANSRNTEISRAQNRRVTFEVN